MIRRSARPPLAGGTPVSPAMALVRMLTGTFPGRALILGLVSKLVVGVLMEAGFRGALAVEVIDRIGTIALLVGGGYFLVKLLGLARRRLLWRVRRKLILSYVFIGVVPALLIVAFFVLCGLLLFFHVSSYLVQSRLRNLTEQAQFQAKAAALELQRAPSPAAIRTILDRRQAGLESQYPGASMALVATPPFGCSGADDATKAAAARAARPSPVSVGRWRHLDPPRDLPAWVGCGGFGGVLTYVPAGQAPGSASRAERRARSSGLTADGDSEAEAARTRNRLVIRGAALPDGPPAFAVIVDIPVNRAIADRLRDETGIHLGRVSAVVGGQGDAQPAVGRPEGAEDTVPETVVVREPLSWVTLLDYTDWTSGRTAPITWAIDLNIARIYDRLSFTQARIGNRSFGQILLVLLAVVAALFLIIEVVALIMGFALAKSITGSVHELFVGTELVRSGNFAHKIKIDTRDQLGELADSFNQMTASIEEGQRQAAEKKRMEEELRIARDIQMSLLPQGPFVMRGVSITAICKPAREVGGDYFDLFRLGDRRLGVMIADVSGKGTSAALYMAEMKGLMLSLSEIYHSPRELMIRANRIIADNLDARSFITMTYAVFDLEAGTMTYARAGHTPLIRVPGAGSARHAEILIPDGLVLGLKIDGGERFTQLLEEVRLVLNPGDLFVFFTDGVSEAMNEASDCFEEARLGRIVEEHGHLPPEELRERILREVEVFVGSAPQHDDMTMILVKIDELDLLPADDVVEGARQLASARS